MYVIFSVCYEALIFLDEMHRPQLSPSTLSVAYFLKFGILHFIHI